MKSLSRERAEFLRVLAARIVPETAELDSAGVHRFLTLIDEALQQREPAVRRQFGTFLAVLRWAPMVRYLGPFEKLSPAHQDAVLRWFQDAPLQLLRAGFWGLKTMVFMGYYGQPETHALIGYAPGSLPEASGHA
jgi:hypothetical protein